MSLFYILIVSCPPLTAPSNGTINCSLGDDGVLSYEDTCSFTCDTDYVLTGSDTRTCQSDGSWSGSNTICTGSYNSLCNTIIVWHGIYSLVKSANIIKYCSMYLIVGIDLIK